MQLTSFKYLHFALLVLILFLAFNLSADVVLMGALLLYILQRKQQ